jgi:hypothetical protein
MWHTNRTKQHKTVGVSLVSAACHAANRTKVTTLCGATMLHLCVQLCDGQQILDLHLVQHKSSELRHPLRDVGVELAPGFKLVARHQIIYVVIRRFECVVDEYRDACNASDPTQLAQWSGTHFNENTRIEELCSTSLNAEVCHRVDRFLVLLREPAQTVEPFQRTLRGRQNRAPK